MSDHKAGQCLGFTLVVLGCLLFAVFSSQYLPALVYTANFHQVTCTVQTSYLAGNACCDPAGVELPEVCSRPYPCYVVAVSYTDAGGVGRAGVVFRQYEDYVYQDNATCSYFSCTAVYNANDYSTEVTDVADFLTDRGTPGSSYECHYDPDDLGTVFLSRSNTALVVNLVIWPIVLIMAGCIVVGIMCARDPENNCCGGKAELGGDDKVIILTQPDKYEYTTGEGPPDSRPKTSMSQATPGNVEVVAMPGYNSGAEHLSRSSIDRPLTGKRNLLQVPT